MRWRAWLREDVVDPCGLSWPRWAPVAVAVAAGAVGVAVVGQRLPSLGPLGVDALVVLVAVAPWAVELATGRHLPLAAFVGLVVAGTTALVLDPVESDVAPFFLLLLVLEVGATRPLPSAIAVVAVAAVTLGLAALPEQSDGWWVWIPGIVAAGIGGIGAQAQVRLLAQERATRHELAERLAAEDRRAVAREVHDVVAHSMGVTMLHVTAARHALESDADAGIAEAVDSLRQAERLGRQAMADIRGTVGLLDGGPGGAGARGAGPMPAAADLPRLVDEFRAAGLRVRYDARGDADRTSPAVGLTVYRVVQESLANVARHAPGADATVSLDATGDALEVRVDDTATPGGPAAADADRPGAGGPGRGLRGMADRVEQLGGALRAGPTPRGWQVVASLPRHPPGP